MESPRDPAPGEQKSPSRRLLAEVRELAATLGDRATYVVAEWLLGAVAFVEAQNEVAIRELEAALLAAEPLDDARTTACILTVRAWALVASRARREEGRVVLERAQRLAGEVGDGYIAGIVDYGFGLYWRSTAPERAVDHFRSAAIRLQPLGDVVHVSIALIQIARLLRVSCPGRTAGGCRAGCRCANRSAAWAPAR